MSHENTFGVTLELSQVDSFYSGSNKPWGKYSLFGHFDGMRVEVVDEASAFPAKTKEHLADSATAIDRISFQPAIQKLFFYMNAKNAVSKKEIIAKLNTYKEGKGKPFLALFAIKIHPMFLNNPRCANDICNHLESHLMNYMEKSTIISDGYDCFVMRSIGIDEIYVLLGMDKPWYDKAMRYSHELTNWSCNLTCASCDLINIPGVDRDEVFKNAIIMLNEKMNNIPDAFNEFTTITPTKTETVILSETLNNCIQSIENRIDTGSSYNLNDINLLIKTLQEVWDTASEDANQTHTHMEWLLDCINTIRACGPIQVVKQTYTVLGYKSSLNGMETKDILELIDFQTYEELELDYLMAPRPGVILSDFVDMFMDELKTVCQTIKSAYNAINVPENLREKKFPHFDIGSKLMNLPTMASGRYDCVWRARLTSAELLCLYTQFIWNRSKTPLKYLRNGYSRLSLLNGTPAKNTELHSHTSEEIYLNRLWAKEQHESVIKLFEHVIKNKASDPDYSHLLPIFHGLSALHAQGCMSFFNSSSWCAFNDARKFFVAFYHQLSTIFMEDLEGETDKEYVRNVLSDIYDSLLTAQNSFAGLFHDRMVTDMSMRENSRPGFYYAGSYEALLKGYSAWVGKLTKLVVKMENDWAITAGVVDTGQDDNSTGFIFVPIENYVIRSSTLFPMRNGDGRLIVYKMPLDEMLDFHHALPSLAHEVGHYKGILLRESRVDAYLSMVSCLFAHLIAKELRERMYVKFPANALEPFAVKLHEELLTYLKLKTKDVCPYLHHIKYACIKAYNEFVNRALSLPNDDMKPLLKALTTLYHEADAVLLMTNGGRLFDQMLEDLFHYALSDCLGILRECYADLIAIRFLDLSAEAFLNAFVHALCRSDSISETGEGLERHYFVNATRILSALMLTSATPPSVEGIVSDMSSMIEKYKIHWQSNQYLVEIFDNYLDGNTFAVNYELTYAWQLASTHLYRAGQVMLDWLPDNIDDVDEMRRLYEAMVYHQGDSMAQLSKFITMSEGGV